MIVCDRCDRKSAACVELEPDQGGAVVRDKGSNVQRRFRACPSCAEALRNQAARAHARAGNIRARARGTPAGREVAAVLDAIAQAPLPYSSGGGDAA